MNSTYTGGCACGAVRYHVTADPVVSAHCQCRDCQRATGAGHASLMAFPRAAVRLEGEVRFHEMHADSGNTTSRGFCPGCGSPVVSKSSGFPDMVVISAGSLDEPARFAPQMVVYASRGHAWDHLDRVLPRFDAGPRAGG